VTDPPIDSGGGPTSETYLAWLVGLLAVVGIAAIFNLAAGLFFLPSAGRCSASSS
jgi:hypothetical protein